MSKEEFPGVSFKYPSASDFVIETANGPIRVPNGLIKGTGSVGKKGKEYLEALKQKDPSSLPTSRQLELIGEHLDSMRIGAHAKPVEDITLEHLLVLWAEYTVLSDKDAALREIFKDRRRADGQKPELLGAIVKGLGNGRIIRTLNYYEGAHPELG